MTEKQSLRSRAAASLAQQPMRRWGIGLGAIVLAISGLFGGWTPAPPPPPATVDTEIDGGAYRVTVTGARVAGDLKPMVLSDKANHWIVVLATIEVTAEQTWKHINNIMQLSPVDGVDGRFAAGVVLLRDARRINQLHPGMPEKVAFFWEQKAGSPIPAEVTVLIKAREYRVNSLTGGEEWMPHDEANTEVSAPVVDKREATQ